MVLYNNSGTLTWNGAPLATGSSISGTTNYLPVFTGPSSLGDSTIYQTGGNVGIGTTTLSAKLTVAGTIKANNIVGTNTGDVSITGENYLSLVGQTLTANAINLGGTNVSGILPVANGGTGATSLSGLLQGNGTGVVTALSGTTGQVPYFSGPGTIATSSSLFLASNGNVGIGTTSPVHKLSLTGNGEVSIALGSTTASSLWTNDQGGAIKWVL